MVSALVRGVREHARRPGSRRTGLTEGVETVSSGAEELTRLEADGYAYIRP
jgi:intracellular sulfur oxidation DsrE/DsrF family protein